MDTDIVTKDYADLESIKTRIYDIRGLKVIINIMRAFVLIRQTVSAWQSTNFIPNNLDHVFDIRNKYNHEMTHYES